LLPRASFVSVSSSTTVSCLARRPSKIDFVGSLRCLVSNFSESRMVIPVTRRVKGYTRFVRKYVTGRRKRFRPHQDY